MVHKKVFAVYMTVHKLMFLLLAGFWLLLSLDSEAQTSQGFSSDPGIFMNELGELFKQPPSDKRQETSRMLSNLRTGLIMGDITPEHFQAMVDAANEMQTKRLRPFIHFFAYFKASLTLVELENDEKNIFDWNRTVIKLVREESQNRMQQFLDLSEAFFRNGVLHRTNSVEWRSIGGEWSMPFDSLPVFLIEDADIRGYASRDSICIYNATGFYRPFELRWAGQKGRIDWRRVGRDPEEVYAEFNNHTITLNSTLFNADSARLHYKEYFPRPVMGSIAYRVISGNAPASTTYPRFTSYSIYLEIRNIFPNIHFTGGFALEGDRILGFGRDRDLASIIIRKDNQNKAVFTSQSFVIRQDRITSQRATFSLYHENDSIYHPGLQMRYLDQEKELVLLRSGEGLSQSPFFSSYHHLDMVFEAMYWPIETNEITFGAMRGLARESTAVFESANYFTAGRFNRIQGIDAQHPLVVIHNYARTYQTDAFYVEDLASYMRMPASQVSALMISLSNLGFLLFNPDDGRVVLKDKTRHYIDAINDRTDYDVIRIESQVEGLVNAVLDIKTFYLEISGVPKVHLSNTQQVKIHPKDGNISMKKGLDFVFKGKINAGFFEFYAQESSFVYEEFKLNLTHIDSMSFSVPVQDSRAPLGQRFERVRTVISDINGDLLIDHPQNKSGKVSFPRYPIFNSKTESYVYYDAWNIQKGVYKRDNFYYHVMPFTIDSLNNFKTDAISFPGYLNSGNIFPIIEEPLKVQSDFSLGFVKSLTRNGLPVYDEAGHAKVELSLSQEGLRGAGSVSFLTSVSRSDEFMFHPDSMMAMLKEFDLKQSIGMVSYPAVYANDVEQKWLVNEDKMVLRSTRNVPFIVYDQQLVHRGTLTLRSSGLFGSGELVYADATFQSAGINFLHDAFGADESSFILNSPAFGKVFHARSYGFDYSFVAKSGNFEKATNRAMVEFPLNQYRARLDSFRWDPDNEEIYFINATDETALITYGVPDILDTEAGRKPSTFVSTHPRQDSLQFFARSALFDLSDYSLGIEGVPVIRVADIAIFPVDGSVNIQNNAVMDPLQGATMIAGVDKRKHQLYNVTATIQGRKNYQASGVYDYTDVAGSTQTIYFNKLTVDSLGRTLGTAQISQPGFTLSPYFDYLGDIRLHADKDNLFFDGAFRIRHECRERALPWVKFRSEVDPQNVRLPLEQPLLSSNDEELSSFLAFSSVENKVYARILEEKPRGSDQLILDAFQEIAFNPVTMEYSIGPRNPDVSNDGNSSRLKLNVERCIISGNGKMNFGENLGHVLTFAAGSADYFMLTDSTAFNLFYVLDFFFDDQAMDMLYESIFSAQLEGLDPGKDVFRNGLAYYLNKEDAQRLITELNQWGNFRRFPPELAKKMVFSDLNLYWNNRTRSFTSTGPIGVFSLNGKPVNRYVDGHIEYVKRRTGDALTIYLQISNNVWYYFSYAQGVMQAISSSEKFNDHLLGIKEDRRTIKARGDEEPYQYIISTVSMRNTFLRRMRSN